MSDTRDAKQHEARRLERERAGRVDVSSLWLMRLELPSRTRELFPFVFGSAKRGYLRVERRNVAFDICAAPFGNSFFFS